jgi:hypothetical protein
MGFEVEPEALTGASAEISKVAASAAGIQVENITGAGESYGHEGVFGAVSRFCTTWQLATQLLQQRAMSAGAALDGAAATYAQHEDNNQQVMTQQSMALGAR